MFGIDSSTTPGYSEGSTSPPRTLSEKEIQLEHKRARGEISCAECRRQKLKCDKKIPCSSCLRRGCQSVCPTGTVPSKTGPNSKPDTKLQKKLLQLSKRIRQLEDALQILQSRVSAEPHPLLTKELLDVKRISGPEVPEEPLENVDPEVYGDFGTLTIADKGITHFVGRSGAKAMLSAIHNDQADEVKRRAFSRLPPEVTFLAGTFPFSPVYRTNEQMLLILESHLPSYDRATALVEAYVQHISFFFRPIKREQITEELLPKFYRRRDGRGPGSDNAEITEHQLALLFAVFACGAAGDLTLDACNEEGEAYRQLARSALSLHSVFEGTSFATVQAVATIGAYDIHSASCQTIESAFKVLTLALGLGITIGLHWDPASWNIELKFVQRRRALFWELFEMDAGKSMASGRPMILRVDDIDCKFPDDEDAQLDEHGVPTQSFWRWKIEYAFKIVSLVATRMSGARPVKYSEILELDRQVRDYASRTPSGSFAVPIDTPYSPGALQNLIKIIQVEAVIFFIHRNFFIMTLRDSPRDPLRSKFASSFLATYSSAITILRALRRDFDCSNYLLLRQWGLWVLALGCGVVVGSIAATRTVADLSQTAAEELDLVIVLFEKATPHPVTKHGVYILRRLRDKARSNFESDDLANGISPGLTLVKTEEVDEALSMIGGTSRIVQQEKQAIRASPFPFSSFTPEGIHATGSFAQREAPPSLIGSYNHASLNEQSMFTMEVDPEINVGGAHYAGENHFFSDKQADNHTSDVFAMIDDVWRAILEDPRLTTTGLTEPRYQL